MIAIAEQLDQKLRTLDPGAASSLARLVQDALDLVDSRNGTCQAAPLPPNFFSRISQDFGPEPFERPPQGTFDKRQEW